MSVSSVKAVIDTQLFLRAAINLNSLPAKIVVHLRHHYELIASEAMLMKFVMCYTDPKFVRSFLFLRVLQDLPPDT